MTPTKRKSPSDTTTTTTNPKTIHFTARNPPWTYLKLQLIHQPNISPAIQSSPLDPLTARTHLTSALSQFLGLSGTSIPIDILKISPETETPQSQSQPQSQQQPQPPDKIVWVRVPRQDAPAVVAAVSSWIGGNTEAADSDGAGSVAWRVCAKGNFLGALAQGSGGDLFKA